LPISEPRELSKALIKRYYSVRGLRVFGAPVYLHISAVAVAALLGLSAVRSPIFGAIAIVSYLCIIFVHEVGHAFVADRLGLGVSSIRIGWIHGVCEYEAPGNEWRTVLVAWGGVAAQVTVAAIVLLIAAAIPGDDLGHFGPVVIFLGYVNLMIAAVNLAPSRDLDGGTAWRIVPLMFRRRRSRQRVRSARGKARKRWGVRD
jgi:Zn-dependent protease